MAKQKDAEDGISKKLSRHARRTEASIEKEISDFLADILAGNDKYLSDAMIQRSQARVLKTIGSFGAYAKEWADGDLKEFYERQVAHADREMKEGKIDLAEFLTTPAARDALLNRGYRAIRMDFNNRFKDLVSVVARKSYDVYSRVQAQSAMFGFKDSDNIKAVIRDMRDGLRQRGVTGFVDRSGRNWRMDAYAEMAARTVTAQARLRAKEMEFLAHGQNLVQISNHWPTCPLCATWNGVIVSLAEPTEKYPYTLQDAYDAGWGHPNCRHNFSLVVEGFSDPSRSEPYSKEEAEEINNQAKESTKALAERQREEDRQKARERYKAKQSATLYESGVLRGTKYSQEYKEKLLELDRVLRSEGIVPTEHRLNKLQGRLNSNKKAYAISSVNDVVDAFKNGEEYFNPGEG